MPTRIRRDGAEFIINNDNQTALLFMYVIKSTKDVFYDPLKRVYINELDTQLINNGIWNAF